jgi:hypothetical protein
VRAQARNGAQKYLVIGLPPRIMVLLSPPALRACRSKQWFHLVLLSLRRCMACLSCVLQDVVEGCQDLWLS